MKASLARKMAREAFSICNPKEVLDMYLYRFFYEKRILSGCKVYI